jgi:predicted transcriptional regulator
MVNKILQLLSIRCSHRKLSQPFAASSPVPARRAVNAPWDAPVASSSRHYVVCLDCGQKFEYDWANMRVLSK